MTDDYNGFISYDQYHKIRDFSDSQIRDARHQAWDEISEDDREILNKAIENDDNYELSMTHIEFDFQVGEEGLVGVRNMTGAANSEIEEAEGGTGSDLHQAACNYCREIAKQEIKMAWVATGEKGQH